MQRLYSWLPILIACLIFTSAAQSPVATGVDSIRSEEIREKLATIASEKFKGRGNGTPELNLAAEYIAGVFQTNALKPAGGAGSYYQHFDIYASRLGSRNDLSIRGMGEAAREVKARVDFLPELWSESATVSGPLELIEGGQAALPNLKGKIAVELEDRIVSDDPEFPANATEGRRLEAAGAVGVIVVQSLADRGRGLIVNLAEGFRDDLPVRLRPMATLGAPDYPKIPVAVLSADIGRPLLAELGKPRAKVEATLTVDVERDIHKTQNVLALVEGSDPSLKNDVMIVGAHYDHDGEAYGQIWYGADDNGSGTSALLELAEAFGNGSARPRRSVLLAAWAGEEKGLLGSRYYVNHPVFPLDRTAAMFQMDMIGRNEEHPANRPQQVPDERAADNANTLNVLGSAFSPELRTTISALNAQTNLTVRFRYDFGAEDLMRRSDQWSFLQRGIPALFFFAGLHPDYHTPRDTPEKINYAKLEKVARLVYLTAFEVASQKVPPAYKAAAPSQ
ncbi:MAG: M28 family peptidase [Acidobacteria bacterium]|nr:M28 family peptidase [Acidobacteriota bacterium]